MFTLSLGHLCTDLDFQTDHLLPDSITTLCAPYYLSLIISFFPYFLYKCIHSSFEIHLVFVTVTVATCSVYLKNLIAMLFVHSKHSLSMLIRKVNNQLDSVKDGAYYCYCAYVLRILRYSHFLSVMLTNTGIFLRGLKLSGESRS